MVRVSAITVNGTGLATEWMTSETFESDLDGMDRQTQNQFFIFITMATSDGACSLIIRDKSAGYAQLPPCAAACQQYCCELDPTRESGHRGEGLHYRLWDWQPSRTDH